MTKDSPSNRSACRGCYYHQPVAAASGSRAQRCCHYLLFTGRARPCPAEACTVKTRAGPRRRKAMTVKG